MSGRSIADSWQQSEVRREVRGIWERREKRCGENWDKGWRTDSGTGAGIKAGAKKTAARKFDWGFWLI